MQRPRRPCPVVGPAVVLYALQRGVGRAEDGLEGDHLAGVMDGDEHSRAIRVERLVLVGNAEDGQPYQPRPARRAMTSSTVS